MSKSYEILADLDRDCEARTAENLVKAERLREEANLFHKRDMEIREAEIAAHQNYGGMRSYVKTFFAGLADSPECEGVLFSERVWFVVKYAAAILARCALNEPASLKIRRLGRSMDNDPIEL